MMKRFLVSSVVLLAVAPTTLVAADQSALLNDIWLAMCAALVLFMQAGFALLESGLARAKNAINVIMKNFTDVGLGSLGYWALGYGIMFGANSSGWLGQSMFFPSAAESSVFLHIVYHTMFAATAATIVSGAVAERCSYLPYIIGAFFITTVIYPVFGSWAWGNNPGGVGWLKGLGFVDAAGSTVVHSVGGWCALGAVVVLGPRLGRYSRKGASRDIPGHNLPMFSLGAFILWLGWFGFNGGAVADDMSDLGRILLNTHLGAVAGICGALIYMLLKRSAILMTTTVNGALGGLVAMTAGCKTMDPGFAILTGLVGGILVAFGWRMLTKLRIDDVVCAVPVHGLCGAWGTLAAGMFYAGDFFEPSRIVAQLIGIITAFVWAFPMSCVLFKALDLLHGLRASSVHEQRGLDFTEHHEIGYGEFMRDRTHSEVSG